MPSRRPAPPVPRLGAAPSARTHVGRPVARLTGRLAELSLFWRVLLANTVVLSVATLLLAVAPVTVSVPIALTELLVLLVGLAAMLGLNVLLVRQALRPLRDLTRTMGQVDPLVPGRRVELPASHSDLHRLAVAFNA